MLIEFETGKKKKQAMRGNGFVFELCEWKDTLDKKTKKPIGWCAYRWYSSLEGALNDIIRLKVCTSQVNTLIGLHDEIKKVKDELRGYYEGI